MLAGMTHASRVLNLDIRQSFVTPKRYIYLTIILRWRAGYEMVYITSGARSAELVKIIAYLAIPSRINVLLKTPRHIIENLKGKGERKERSFREHRKNGIIFDQMQYTKRARKPFDVLQRFWSS